MTCFFDRKTANSSKIMDAASEEWLAELGIMEAPLEYDDMDVSLSSESFACCTIDELLGEIGIVTGVDPRLGYCERPNEMVMNTASSWGLSSTNNEPICYPKHYENNSPPSSSIPYIPSFTNPKSSSLQINDSSELSLKSREEMDFSYKTMNNNHVCNVEGYQVKESKGLKKRGRSMASSSNNPVVPEHVIVERKRREKVSERLIALSALIPGLKKMDKVFVLAEAIKYLKHLQEQIKTLEERAKQQNLESIVLLKKSHLNMDIDDKDNANSSSSSNQESYGEVALPELEARIMDKEVLIRIHCGKLHGLDLLAKMVNEMENLHLLVTNSNSMAFGNHDLVITIMAQMKAKYNISPKDLVSKLKTVF